MKTKAVFHIDEIEKWGLLLGNVKNLCAGIDIENAEIEVVANSVAVKCYKKKDDEYKDKMEELIRMGIKFCACSNALRNLGIESKDLYEFVIIVPIGVKEIIEKQQIGFAYIKP